MSTRRRIGVSIATTEAARRQLMQPVPVWEKQWATPENAPAGTAMKAYKWVKTDRVQQFSDDEGEVDEPLAPLPDEPEATEGDEAMDEDDAPLVGDASQAPAAADGTDLAAPNITAEQPDEPSKPSSPKAQPLSLQPASQPPSERPSDTLDASLKPIDGSIDAVVDSGEKLDPEDVNGLNMSMLGPDGTAFEAAHDLSQIEGQEDALMGGPMMDQSSDPFEGTK